MKTVDISWNEKRKVIYNRHTGEYLLDNTDDELLDQSGFYCIYGHHPLYGSDVLLYIGETKEGRDGNRTFRHRLKEHFRGRFWHHQNLWFSTGTSDSSLSEHEVQVVELMCVEKTV